MGYFLLFRRLSKRSGTALPMHGFGGGMKHNKLPTLPNASCSTGTSSPPPALHEAQEPIYVTRSILPDQEEYNACTERIFATRHLTNHGACVNELEARLSACLNVPHLALCANGTLALQLALRAASLAGKEVVTTPFSYAATVSALLWEGCTPVFADIDEETLCLNPQTLSERITSATTGVLPVHIYGNICDVDALETVAREAGLAVVYDAAQCFGSSYNARSVLDYGDFSACSFHATKVFHTAEGGCVVSRTQEGLEMLRLMRACGHYGDRHVCLGTNAKLSELHAAVGLCLLDSFGGNINGRRKVSQIYDTLLSTRGLRRPVLREGLTYNHAYYPVIFDTEKSLLRVVANLNRENIFPRRYFYPALNTLPYLPRHQPCPVAESVAKRALCLPLYRELSETDVERICAIVHRSI